jgi:hypothetical protein
LPVHRTDRYPLDGGFAVDLGTAEELFDAVATTQGSDGELRGEVTHPASLVLSGSIVDQRLLEPGLVRQVAERGVRGIHEGAYQATGRSYWLSPPSLVGRIGLPPSRDRLSLGHLADLMENVQADVTAPGVTGSPGPWTARS